MFCGQSEVKILTVESVPHTATSDENNYRRNGPHSWAFVKGSFVAISGGQVSRPEISPMTVHRGTRQHANGREPDRTSQLCLLSYCPFLNVSSQTVLTDPNLSFRAYSRSHCLFWLLPSPEPTRSACPPPCQVCSNTKYPFPGHKQRFFINARTVRAKRPVATSISCLSSSGNGPGGNKRPEEILLLPDPKGVRHVSYPSLVAQLVWSSVLSPVSKDLHSFNVWRKSVPRVHEMFTRMCMHMRTIHTHVRTRMHISTSLTLANNNLYVHLPAK